ncbi:MAG: hypothetical protein VX642_05205 [Bdellovibrionota bacterium]|nr:hypothetical protein [Bdellovibrionota bacterium]
MTKYLFALSFFIVLLHPKTANSCEIIYEDPSEKEWLLEEEVCEDSLLALIEQSVINEEDLQYIDLIIEVLHRGQTQVLLIIQVWDGDYLIGSYTATKNLETEPDLGPSGIF